MRGRIGAAIDRERQKLKLGVSALALAADVDLSQFAKALRGEAGLSIYSLARVAAVLGCPISTLLDAPRHTASVDGLTVHGKSTNRGRAARSVLRSHT
jgi:transcriptional regulator with XRE-family HTH domain